MTAQPMVPLAEAGRIMRYVGRESVATLLERAAVPAVPVAAMRVRYACDECGLLGDERDECEECGTREFHRVVFAPYPEAAS